VAQFIPNLAAHFKEEFILEHIVPSYRILIYMNP
tara:strand:+ start:152 stop:253 length:102 start_codon:yes stop_codon:yes gene_type:complete